MKIVILLPIILVVLFFTTCSESVTPPVEDNSINIKFPIGKNIRESKVVNRIYYIFRFTIYNNLDYPLETLIIFS